MKKSVLWTIVALVLIIISIVVVIGVIAFKSAGAEINEYNDHLHFIKKEINPVTDDTYNYFEEVAKQSDENIGDISEWYVMGGGIEENLELKGNLEEAKDKLVMTTLKSEDAQQLNKDQIKILDQFIETLDDIDLFYDDTENFAELFTGNVNDINDLYDVRNKHAEE